MRKALIVGIDCYDHIGSLSGCVHDALSVRSVLERHANGTINFTTPKLLVGTDTTNRVEKKQLKDAIRELFSDNSEIALFYFAGHGYIEDTGGFLCSTECKTGDEGLSLAELIKFANGSPAKNRIVILDSCHSGIAGNDTEQMVARVNEGMTILTASTAEQYAMEVPGGGGGVFTSLLVDALGGAAANLLGDVTPGSVYAHIDQSLGPWAQRPMFKTNVKTFVSLRKTEAPISLSDLRALAIHFPYPDYNFPLDPTYEPERSAEHKANPDIPPPDPLKNAIFAVLQRYVRVNLVRPVGETHMWHAAMNSKSCELTALGRHYHHLVENKLI